MALGVLLILFVSMLVISAVGILGMFVIKNPRVKAGMFYGMTAWAMVIACLSASGQPDNYLAGKLLRLFFGFLALAGGVLYFKAETNKQRVTARILVTFAIAAGIERMFYLL